MALQELAASSTREIDISELTKVSERYKDIPDIIFSIDSTNEWKDENLSKKEKLWLPKLEDLESDVAREAYIQSAIECLCKQVSCSSVAALITLAWNMLSPDNPNRDVFTRNETYVKEVATSSTDLSKKVIAYAKNATAFYKLPNTYQKKRQAVAYVAGSALRLITVPAENYINAFGHIARSYRNFYSEEFPIKMSLDANCVEMTQVLLRQERKDCLKSSVVPFLYHYDELKGGDKAMCKMLFEQNLSYTGIHAYPLFLTAAKELELDTDVLMGLLNNRQTSDGLEVIQHILDEYEFPDERWGNQAKRQGKNVQRTWKYARIFDERVFAKLQTKNCGFLVAVLAYLNRIVGTSGPDPTRIKQIENLVRSRDLISRHALR